MRLKTLSRRFLTTSSFLQIRVRLRSPSYVGRTVQGTTISISVVNRTERKLVQRILGKNQSRGIESKNKIENKLEYNFVSGDGNVKQLEMKITRGR